MIKFAIGLVSGAAMTLLSIVGVAFNEMRKQSEHDERVWNAS